MTTSHAAADLAGHVWRQLWRAALVWATAIILAVVAAVLGYQAAYPTAADRARFAAGMGTNMGVQAIAGLARRVDTAGGFAAGRLGVFVPVALAVWGFLAATRLLRGEEDAGRWDVLRSGTLTARRAVAATLAGIGLAALAIWALVAAALVGLGLRADLPADRSLLLALTLTVSAVAFAALGALTAQLASTRRGAAAVAGLVLGAAYLLRLVADGSPGNSWLRWASPLGWIEEIQPFAAGHLLPLGLLAAWTLLLGLAAAELAARRDAGAAIIAGRPRQHAGSGLLGSPTALALRLARGPLAAWALGAGAFALTAGAIAKSVVTSRSGAGGLASRLGAPASTVPGYLSFAVFFFLQVIVTLLAASQIAAIREEEATGRFENVIARAVGRRRWLAGRTAIALGSVLAVALFAGFLAWAGAAWQHTGVDLGRFAVASLNVVPVAILFLGLGLLTFALAPKYAHLTTAAVAVAVAWDLIGSITKAPPWALGITPFHHVAASPALPVNVPAALTMLILGTAAITAAIEAFARRGLVTE